MATFTGNAKVVINGDFTSAIDIGTLSHAVRYTQSDAITSGTGADQANMIFVDTRTIAASTTEDLDLAGGLTDAFGAAITFTKIKAIMIKAAAANTNNVHVGGDANGLAGLFGDLSDLIVVRPGGTFYISAPDATAYAVTGGTGDILQVANSSSGTGVDYDIIIIGTV